MKKITSFLNLLAVSLVLFAGVCPANAAPALKGFSPTTALFTNPNGTIVPIGGNAAGVGGLPAWYQDQNGVAVKPCLDIARCGLGLGGVPDFNPLLPMQIVGGLATNFPSEAFYFNATANFVMPGASDVLLVMALEYTFLDQLGALTSLAATPLANANPFQRLRLVHTFVGGGGSPAALGLPAGGNFTVTTPWGVTIFPLASAKCVNQGGDTKCSMVRDQPVAGPNFVAALGETVLAPGSISTFLKDPTAPVGFLGLGAAVLGYTDTLGVAKTVTVVDPLGRSSGPIPSLKVLTGQTVGLEITPPAAGTDFGVMKPANAVPVRKTFNINNLAGVAVPLTITANIPNSTPVTVSPDFTIAPSALTPCPIPPLALAIGATCNFDVIFNPTTADGPKAAAIAITGPGAPSAQASVTGIADSTPPTLTVNPISFTNVAATPISGTVTDANGIGSVQVIAGASAPVTATVTAGTWNATVTLPVLNAANTITVTATDTALTGGNITTAPTFTITHDNIAPVVAPTVTPVLNAGFVNTASPTLTTNVTEANPAGGTITVDLGVLPSTTVPATQVIGPLADGAHSVKVVVNDSAGNSGTSTINFTVDTTAPAIALTSPAVNAANPAAPTMGVTAPVLTFPITDANIDPTKTVVTLDGVPLVSPVSGTTTLGPFTVGGAHTLTIAATDLAGNVAPVKTVNFSLLLSDGAITSLGATAPTIADVIQTLKVAIGGFPEVAGITPATDAFKHGDVAPLDVTGKPAPNGVIDVGDVLTILKKVVGIITTF